MAIAYYTLTDLGQRWFTGKATPPRSNLKILNALAGMLTENNVPRTSQQIAHITNQLTPAVETGIATLVRDGYIQLGHLPQPIEKSETPKPRVRPVEEIVKSEIKAQEARRRYDESEKGIIAHINYEYSEKGVTKNQRYWSTRGRLIQKAWRLRRNIKSMTELKIDQKLIDIEIAKLKEVDEELKKEE